MECNISKWGNSYAVRIPKDIVDEFGWNENIPLELEAKEEKIILKAGKELALKRILEKIKPQKEMDWGEARGKELW